MNEHLSSSSYGLVRNNEGLFQTGLRGGGLTAKDPSLHDPMLLSLPYLDTSDEGILHVIPSWNQISVLSDLSYTFKAGYSMTVRVPFLNNARCQVRKYQCNGASICPRATEAFRNKTHYSVDAIDVDVLQNITLQGMTPKQTVFRSAVTVSQKILKKEQFCTMRVFTRDDSTSGGIRYASRLCDGNPVVRFSKKYDCYIIGCSKWKPECINLGLSHYFWKLSCWNIDESGAEVIKRMLAGEHVEMDESAFCTFVLEKKRRKATTCDSHAEKLVDSRPCQNEMMIVQPIMEPKPVAAVTSECSQRRGFSRISDQRQIHKESFMLSAKERTHIRRCHPLALRFEK